MKILNNLINTFKAPVPLFDRVLEFVALFMLIALLSFTAFLYQLAPDKVPSRFDALGEPIQWADKEIYWYMAVFFIMIKLVSSASAYEIRLMRFPVRLKEPVIELQKKFIFRMSRCVTLCIGLCWLSYLLFSSATFLALPKFVYLFSRLSFAFLLLIILFFSVKVWWVGRKYHT